jgi:hypothetical protein
MFDDLICIRNILKYKELEIEIYECNILYTRMLIGRYIVYLYKYRYKFHYFYLMILLINTLNNIFK